MCYLPPGPRCSHHAHQELMRTIQAVNLETNVSRKIQLQAKVDDARKAYYTTPRGQNELHRNIASLSTLVAAGDDSKKDELSTLKLYMSNGVISRKNQLVAYKIAQENKQSDIKEVLRTGNKQKLAVGMAFHQLMKHYETTSIDAHILRDDMIEVRDFTDHELYKVFCMQQKYQSVYSVLKTNTDTQRLFFVDNSVDSSVEEIFNTYNSFEAVSDAAMEVLKHWVITNWLNNNVRFVASVDVRTEQVHFVPVESIFDTHTLSFKKKPKRGGTSPYRHGNSDVLREELKGTVFEDSVVETTQVEGVKRTYLTDAPVTDLSNCQTTHFFFVPHWSPSGTIYYEVKARHIPNQFELFLVLTRTTKVLANTDSEHLTETFPRLKARNG